MHVYIYIRNYIRTFATKMLNDKNIRVQEKSESKIQILMYKIIK